MFAQGGLLWRRKGGPFACCTWEERNKLGQVENVQTLVPHVVTVLVIAPFYIEQAHRSKAHYTQVFLGERARIACV